MTEPSGGDAYRLVYSGDRVPGVSREAVLERLARLFNRPGGELEPLLSGDLHVLKVGPTPASLEPFRAAMASTGALARIEAAPHASPPATGAAGTAPPSPAGTPAKPAPEAAASGVPPAAPGPAGDNSVASFLAATRATADGGHFALHGQRFLRVALDGAVWIKTGAMVAYTGDVRFTREGLMQHGVARLLKRSVSGEGTRLTRASGIGSMFLADHGKKITLLRLDGDELVVNGRDILAFETSVEWDITVMKSISALVSGGLFNVHLRGRGLVAITTHHDPLTLEVQHAYPVHTDPGATVAWSASLTPSFKTDVSVRTFLGRGSGESFQMVFEGEGYVVVQPHEDTPPGR